MSTIPTTNITTSLVRDTLGETSESAGGAGNNVGKLCTSPNINMWSKRKPVGLPVIACQDFDTGQSFYYKDWWKGEYGDCGISCNRITFTYADAIKILSNIQLINTQTWNYNCPTGGADSPFRIGDFRGYDHDAVPCIALYSGYSFNTFYNDGSGYSLEIDVDGGNGVSNLQLVDLTGIDWSNMMLVAFLFSGTTFIASLSADTPLNDIDAGRILYGNLQSIPNGSYNVYFLLKDMSQSYTYLSIPNGNVQNPKILTKYFNSPIKFPISNINTDIELSWDYNGVFKDWGLVDADNATAPLTLQTLGYISFKITLKNDSASVVTFSSGSFTINCNNSNTNVYGKTAFVYVDGVKQTSITVSAGSSMEVIIVSAEQLLYWSNITLQQMYPAEVALIFKSVREIFAGTINYKYGSTGWV